MEKIIVPDAPFVSDLLSDFIKRSGIKILKNDFTDNDERLRLSEAADEKQLKQDIADGKNVIVYSNSENSLSRILKLFEGTEFAEKVGFFKDKYRFREILKQLYPDFYYKKLSRRELEELDSLSLPYPLVLKPQCGFLSLGVYPLYSAQDFENAVKEIQNEVNSFPEDVVNFDNFLLEQMIGGEEYAVDAFFDSSGKPVVLNIFHHPFTGEQDVGDRIYVTSPSLIANELEEVTLFLDKLANIVELKNFPFHIELRKDKNGLIPIECNPLRFAGWCTTDLAYYAYKISTYDYFFNDKKPDWKKILAECESGFYYFSIAEVPKNISREDIAMFDYEHFYKQFSDCRKMYSFDFKVNPVFAVLFGHCKDSGEVQEILHRDLLPFIIKGRKAE